MIHNRVTLTPDKKQGEEEMAETTMMKAERKLREAEEAARIALEELEEVKRAEATLTPEQMLAIEIHNINCHYEHTETCGWFYEIRNKVHNWDDWTHKRYLEKAVALREEFPEMTAEAVIRIIELAK